MYYLQKLINAVTIKEFTKLINKLPTNGTIKNALGDGPYLLSTDCILAIAVGTAPNPKPQCPTAIIAASYVLPINLNVTNIAKRNIITVCASNNIIIGIAKSANCHNLSVIIDSAKKISNEMLLIMDISFSLSLNLVVLSAIFLIIKLFPLVGCNFPHLCSSAVFSPGACIVCTYFA